jgi:predicted O-linked N-acetylglucosamine transferase (SPINDLY family)
MDQPLQIAMQHHQAGRLREAEAIYRQVLQHQPDHPTALCLLGVIGHQVNRDADAVELIDRAIALDPNVPEFHFHYGEAWRGLRRLDEAVAAYRRALQLRPDYRDAVNNLGIVLAEQRHFREAVAAFERAVALNPQQPEGHSNLGNALSDCGRLGEAVACYQKAVALAPDFAAAHMNLGSALLKQGRLAEALAVTRRAIQLQPQYAKAHNNLGVIWLHLKRPADAVTACQTAVQLNPGYADACGNLSMALQTLGRQDEAIAWGRRAIQLNPQSPDAYNNLANALSERGQLTEAIACYHKALELRPDYLEADNNLGTCCEKLGKLDEAIACYRRVIARKPDYVSAHNNLLIALQYHQDHDPQALFAEHLRWARQHAEPLAAARRPHDNDRTPHRRLRLGYVSPDLRQHPIPFFLEPLLAAHDHEHFTVTCYADLVRPDLVTQRLRGYADEWRDVTGMPDEEVADLVRRDRIDLLVDLAVHAPYNRLLVFARKPAPVQLTYLGYCNTSGLAAIDYRVTDAHVDPPGLTEAYHSEQLLRLPASFCCYRPPEEAPPVNPLPARRSGQVTFASLNRLAKITPQVMELWSRILAAVPGSGLMMQANGLGDAATQQYVRDTFGKHGIAADRLLLLDWGSFDQYLAQFHQIDIALDTFPFTGHTTTCHSLWMGVPVVTLAGRTPIARVGVSLLSNLGLGELIIDTPDAYVEIASQLAGDWERLEQLRAGMRERMSRSPLLDARTFTRNLEEAYRRAWETWCAG